MKEDKTTDRALSMFIGDIGNDSSIIFRIKEELKKESDRGCALVSAAYIEAELKKMISSFLVEMSSSETKEIFSFNGPIGTFSSKIKLAYSMGLISKDISFSIDQLRAIRNICAHLEKPFDFDKENIKAHIKNMTTSIDKSFSSLREELIEKILVIIATLHFHRVNIHRKMPLDNILVEIKDNQHEQEIHLAALRIMEIGNPQPTYEQAVELARKVNQMD